MLFVNSKNMARDLYSFLMRSGYHERTSSLHGDITQAERERGLRHMKQNPRSIMVATDLGARGLPSRPLVGWPDILPFAPTFPGRNACLGKSDHHMVGLDESHGGGVGANSLRCQSCWGPFLSIFPMCFPPVQTPRCADLGDQFMRMSTRHPGCSRLISPRVHQNRLSKETLETAAGIAAL